MSSKRKIFDEYVVRSILANSKYDITSVNDLRSLRSLFYIQEEYLLIVDFIKAGNIKAIETFPENQARSDEFLDIMSFNDQLHRKFIVTVYDNLELWQNPEVIDIFIAE